MKTLTIGSIIKIKELEKELFDSRLENISSTKEGILFLNTVLMDKETKFFELIRRFYPELKNYEFVYRKKDGEIMITKIGIS